MRLRTDWKLIKIAIGRFRNYLCVAYTLSNLLYIHYFRGLDKSLDNYAI